jgi:hypothetical protein
LDYTPLGGRNPAATNQVLRLLTTIAGPTVGRSRPRPRLRREEGEAIMTTTLAEPQSLPTTDGNSFQDEAAEILDGLLGDHTVFHFRGRIRGGGPIIEFTIDPMAFAKRLLLDCFTEALAETWVRRAETFHQAKPRLRDFQGRYPTRHDFFAAVHRSQEVTAACLRHAELLAEGDPWEQYETERDALLAALETVR